MKRVEMDRVELHAPVPSLHLALAGEWLLGLHPDKEPTPELVEVAHRYFMQNFYDRPNSMFWGVSVDMEPIGIFGFFDIDPISESAVVFGIGDREEIEANHRGLGRGLLGWTLETMVPTYFRTVRAHCRERHVINMMKRVGFEEVDLGDAVLEMRG